MALRTEGSRTLKGYVTLRPKSRGYRAPVGSQEALESPHRKTHIYTQRYRDTETQRQRHRDT
eukprot:3031295-Rhodomonas_salina.1